MILKKRTPDPESSFLKSALDPEPMLAAGTYHGVFSLGAGKAKNRAAARAFAIDVSFAVAKPIPKQFEESAEGFVLPPTLRNVSGKHPKENDHDQYSRDRQIREDQNGAHLRIGHEKGNDGIKKHDGNVDSQVDLVESIGAVPSVHHPI